MSVDDIGVVRINSENVRLERVVGLRTRHVTTNPIDGLLGNVCCLRSTFAKEERPSRGGEFVGDCLPAEPR